MRGRLLAALVMMTALGACGRGEAGGPSTSNLLVQSLRTDAPLSLEAGDTVHVSQSVKNFYRTREHALAWVDGDELSDTGEAVYRALAESDADGLPASLYRVPAMQAVLERLGGKDAAGEKPTATQKNALRVQLDVLLSEGVVRYAQDLARGTIDPADAGLDWRIEREHAPQVSVLEALANGSDPAEILAGMRPASAHYERFRQALARYREVAARGGWSQVPRNFSAAPGDSAPEVGLLRQRFLSGADATEARLAAAGQARPQVFDEQLAEAVRNFQQRHSIDADGRPGEATLRELNHTLDERIAELKLNMDRWRWLPHELGERYILVNVAGFELEVVQDNRVIETMNVVVGEQNWRTPIFADTMEYLVVNPYWNVPQSILEDEIFPAMARDPAYLERNNMERTSNGGIRQRPGPKNALGKFKFMFPNKDNIYLHDTPAGHLFSRTRRDFSHGCIRLERPRDMAELLMRTQTKRSPSELDRLLADGNEQWIRFDEKLPIYILYFTAWVQEDGTIRFHHDVYGRDEKVQEQVADKLT